MVQHPFPRCGFAAQSSHFGNRPMVKSGLSYNSVQEFLQQRHGLETPPFQPVEEIFSGLSLNSF